MQTVARRPPQTVAQIVERACRQSCRSFRFRFIILVVSQRPRAGIVRDLREQVKVIVGTGDGRSRVVVSDGDQVARLRIVGIRSRQRRSLPVRRPGLSFNRQPVPVIVRVAFPMAVGIGFSRHQAGGVVIAPRRHVPVRPFPRIGSNGFPRNAERHEGYQPVRIIVAKDGGLKGRTVFGGFASPRVISVAGRVAQGIRDAGGGSRGRVILDGGRIAGGVRPGCFTSGDVKDGNGGIAAGVRISLRAAAGRISAGRSGQNSRMVFPGYGVTVYDDSFRNDGRSRGLRFYRPSGRSRVFRPLQGFIAPRIGGDVFSGQRGGQEGNQLGRAFRICCSLAVAARDCGYPVHAVFPLPAGIGVLRD